MLRHSLSLLVFLVPLVWGVTCSGGSLLLEGRFLCCLKCEFLLLSSALGWSNCVVCSDQPEGNFLSLETSPAVPQQAPA